MFKFFILFVNITVIVQAATIEGTVSYAGSNKKAKTLKMDSDPVCGNSHEIPPIKEDFILDSNNNFKNVLVWINNIKFEEDIDTLPIQINQKGCIYDPHVLGVMTNQKILIKNSDKTLHNIHSMPNVNTSFNSAQPAGVPDLEQYFITAEDPFYIKCDVHPWMKSWVLVSDHPYFAVTNDSGYYKIENVPPGTYEVIFWQEKLSKLPKKKYIQVSNTKSVTITEDTIAFDLNYQFQKPKKKEKK